MGQAGQGKRREAGLNLKKLLVLFFALICGCRAPGLAPVYVVNELAPTRTLRALVDYRVPAVAARDPRTGESRGVGVDLARELSWRLDLPIEFVAYDSAAKLAPGAPWDVALVSLDAARAAKLVYTEPYMTVDGAEQVIAMPLDHQLAAGYVRRFVEEAKTSGFLAAAIERSRR